MFLVKPARSWNTGVPSCLGFCVPDCSLQGPCDSFQTGKGRGGQRPVLTAATCGQAQEGNTSLPIAHFRARPRELPVQPIYEPPGFRGIGHTVARGPGEKASRIDLLLDLVQKAYSASPTVLKPRGVLPPRQLEQEYLLSLPSGVQHTGGRRSEQTCLPVPSQAKQQWL